MKKVNYFPSLEEKILNNVTVLLFSTGVVAFFMVGFFVFDAEAKILYFDSSGNHCDDSTGKPFFCSIDKAADVANPGDSIVAWPQGASDILDINEDGVVDATDAGLITSNWGLPSNPRADITYDGVVDVTDFSIFLYRRQGYGISAEEKVPFSPPSALAARLFISPNSGPVTIGDSFFVFIKIDAESADVNAGEGTVHFSNDMLQVVSVSRDNSIFDVWPLEPTYSNEEGTIQFVGGTNSIFNGSSGTVLKIVFVAQKEGAAQVNLSGSRIIRKGSDVLRGTTGAVYAINRPPVVPATGEEIEKKKQKQAAPEGGEPRSEESEREKEVEEAPMPEGVGVPTKSVGKDPPALFDVVASPGPSPKEYSLLVMGIIAIFGLVVIYTIYGGIGWYRRMKRK